MKRISDHGALAVTVAVGLALHVGGAIGYIIGNNRLRLPSHDQTAMFDAGEPTTAYDGITVGGAKLSPHQAVLDNAASTPALTKFVAAVRAAGVDSILSGSEPVTVFAPTNDAFAALPGDIDGLLPAEASPQLTAFVQRHIVRGVYTLAELRDLAGSGQTLTSMAGIPLSLRLDGSTLSVGVNAGTGVPFGDGDGVSTNGIVHSLQGIIQ